MDADGAGQTNLTDDSAVDDGAAWSPDGTKIAYTSGQGRNAEVYVIDADGNNRTALTDNLAFDGEPAWSPDGRRIAFTSDRDGNAEIYVMDADGSDPTRLTTSDTFDGEPSWSPDRAADRLRLVPLGQPRRVRHGRRRERRDEPHERSGVRQRARLVTGRRRDRVRHRP